MGTALLAPIFRNRCFVNHLKKFDELRNQNCKQFLFWNTKKLEAELEKTVTSCPLTEKKAAKGTSTNEEVIRDILCLRFPCPSQKKQNQRIVLER
jgi:hypothetical protein